LTNGPCRNIDDTEHVYSCEMRSYLDRFGFLVLLCAALSSRPAVAAPVWSDPLTGAQIDTTHWTINTPAAGLTLAPSSMGVLMSMSASAQNPDLGVSVVSRCLLNGDFDVQVDYQLGLWPDHSGVRTALGMNDTPTTNTCSIQRDSLSATADVAVQMPGSEVYVGTVGPNFQPFPDVPTTDTQGTLRLTRTGVTETAYFAAPGGGWTTVYSHDNTAVPVYGALAVWSSPGYRSTPGGGSSIYFRNYVVNAGQLSCPDAGAPDAAMPDAATSMLDAATPDVSTPDAVALDAATSDVAAADLGGGSADGGAKTPSSGCGCNFGSGNTSAGGGLLSLAVLAMLRRRRRLPS
jgi:MYXO-CTERM domain-containing protein